MPQLPRTLCRYYPIGLILLTGIGFTGLTTTALEQIEQQRQAAEHQRQVITITATLQEVINQKLSQPLFLATLIESTPSFTPPQFHDLSQSLLKNDRAINTLGWVQYVTQAQRPAYEARYGPIVDQTPDGQWQPATDRSEYFPMNQSVSHDHGDRLGRDVAQDPIQLKGLATAHGAGLISMTDLIPPPHHDQTHHDQTFMAFVPVFQNLGQPDPPARGFVQAVFQLQPFIEDTLAPIDSQGKDLYILNGDHDSEQSWWIQRDGQSQAIALQHQSPPDLHDVCPQIQQCEDQIAIGQYHWRVIIPPLPSAQFSQNFQQQLWLMRILGSGMTIGMAIYMAIVMRQRRQIQELVGFKTSQTDQLTQTLCTLQETQSQLVQSAKMSSLGQLVAGIAHEVNNPINFIHGNLGYVERYSHDLLAIIADCQREDFAPQTLKQRLAAYDLDFLQEDLPKILQSMQTGTKRIREIVLALRNFSRLDEAERKSVNLHDGIESTLMILQHCLDRPAPSSPITIVKQYATLPEIHCYPGLLNQVLITLITNAIDAVATNPTDRPAQITIQTCWVGNLAQIGISDNGSGISESNQASLFNPFFTTKPVGEGTGLGLSISYKIITEQHGGKIWAESVLDQGTTFWIELPNVTASPEIVDRVAHDVGSIGAI